MISLQIVVVSDIDGTRNQEKRYTFDYALGPEFKNQVLKFAIYTKYLLCKENITQLNFMCE